MNYKSIAKCDVALRPLTVVVGRNGSGKSNFLDSLHFVADALTTSLEYALRKRGGFRSVIHRRRGTLMSIELAFRLRNDGRGKFVLVLDRGMVRREELNLRTADGDTLAAYERAGRTFRVEIGGEPLIAVPSVLLDRLSLVALSGLEEFREAFETLATMRFYRLDPDAMREMHDPDEGDVLRENGANLASVWGRLEKQHSTLLNRVSRYLTAIVPDIKRVRYVRRPAEETLRFYQSVAGRDEAFPVRSMSDGTLRALGALVASRQGNGSGRTASVIAIEEPETALHPGAVAPLMDALHEASSNTQIIVTSHSPDVVDHVDIESDALLVTEAREGTTVIAGVDSASREAIRRHLYTPGELLRMDQLQPAADTTV